MEEIMATEVWAAFANETRLEVLKLLRQNRNGVSAGDIARYLSIPPSSLSFHLSALQEAKLVKSRRNGRQTTYTFNSGQIKIAGHQLLIFAD